MRLDIPHDREYVRRREAEVPPPPKSIRNDTDTCSASPLTWRIGKLQKRASENHAHYITQPRLNRSIEPDHDPVDKRRPSRASSAAYTRGHCNNIRGLRTSAGGTKLARRSGPAFRGARGRDVVQTIYGGDERAARTDLRFLRDLK